MKTDPWRPPGHLLTKIEADVKRMLKDGGVMLVRVGFSDEDPDAVLLLFQPKRSNSSHVGLCVKMAPEETLRRRVLDTVQVMMADDV